ncbi:hypothetical protein FDV58_17880 [Bradyrhizobium elkanii]|uniref:Uncharacterized protein n=1 Tax=Bradyrhizobium elkanii TaxID=29448 RepID=A0A4U6RXZ7_BRAEL|nr:hypothetical protein [Bradyrhizobium elkanii]TKV80119.1 hypothetical protein FDV58_17880 [Bradyrhizobium elkanii]
MTSVADLLHVLRFLHGYDALAGQKGIKLSLGTDFHEYVSITRATATKGPTYPNFRPDRSPIRSGEGFWMAGVDKNNEVAVLQAVRLYDLSRSNFAEHLESLKAFYADPTKHAHPEDACVCAAPSAKKMSGKVAYHGDGWVRADFRGSGMPEIMAGIAFGVSFALWTPDFVCGLVARWLIDKGVVSQYGYAHHERAGSVLRLVEEEIVDDDWLIWLTGDELRSRIVRQEKAELMLVS